MYRILTELSARQIIVFLRESAIQPISIIWLIVMRHLLENIEMGTFDSICDVNNENMRHVVMQKPHTLHSGVGCHLTACRTYSFCRNLKVDHHHQHHRRISQ